MTDLTCEICRDLLPLVEDGIASRESEEAVRAHLASCPACRELAGEKTPPPHPDAGNIWKRMRKTVRLCALLLMLLGVFAGLSVSGGENLFYNVLLMPAAGALGYGLFRWKAAAGIPALLFLMNFVLNRLGMIWHGEHLGLLPILWWSVLYSALAAVGTLIAGLLHFALKKEKPYEK